MTRPSLPSSTRAVGDPEEAVGASVNGPFFTVEQHRAIAAGLETVAVWALAVEDPEDQLLDRVKREDVATLVVGLATVSRLLALELAAATGRTEAQVLADLRRHVDDGHPHR